jgi:hypothetical protein
MTNTVNYRDLFFEYTDLDRINGEPNPENLLRFQKQLKANARSVYSNLGGGQNGHLFLVLSPAAYALISNTPFVRPDHPGTLIIPPNNTEAQIRVLKDAHKLRLATFKEVTGVEQALKQQIIKAVDNTYLTAIRNRQTNSLTGTVQQIINHLLDTYGRITPTMIDDYEQNLKSLTYDPASPIDNIFNAVEDLMEYAELATQPYTQRQAVAKAYTIINKTGRFKEAIKSWIRRAPQTQTWIAFKDAFRIAHREYRETTNLALEASELEQHNAHLVQQVVDGVQSSLSSDSNKQLTEVVNAVTQSQTDQQQLTQQLREMQTMLTTMQGQLNHQQGDGYDNRNDGRTSRGGGRGGRGRGRGRGRSTWVPDTSKYCWTHGACAHTGKQCRTKAAGHEDTATLLEKMDGSTKNT